MILKIKIYNKSLNMTDFAHHYLNNFHQQNYLKTYKINYYNAYIKCYLY